MFQFVITTSWQDHYLHVALKSTRIEALCTVSIHFPRWAQWFWSSLCTDKSS